jgi:hypothetical protein
MNKSVLFNFNDIGTIKLIMKIKYEQSKLN